MSIDPDLEPDWTREVAAERGDLDFLLSTPRGKTWLTESEVKYLILAKNGRWYVYLIFFYLGPGFRLLMKGIDHYHSWERALKFAQIFQRGSRKDARGTLKRKKHGYRICYN